LHRLRLIYETNLLSLISPLLVSEHPMVNPKSLIGRMALKKYIRVLNIVLHAFHDHLLELVVPLRSKASIHYRNQALCRVSRALGKALNTLGKGFAECHTRQRAYSKKAVGKAAFAECLLSGIRQRLCRVPLGKGRTEKI
jgi:hypothetical protein